MFEKIIDFFRLVRWFHQLLAIFPFVTLYLIIHNESSLKNLDCALSGLHFTALCLNVLFIMFTGFIMNDIADLKIDKINSHIIDRKISLKAAYFLFYLFTFLALLLTLWLSLTIRIEWIILSPIIFIFSLSYNLYLKRSPLFGNITIAILSASVPLTILLFSYDCVQHINNDRLNILILIYSFFPSLIIIPRELSLDISDMEGDKADNCKTLPILIGAKKTKVIVISMMIAIIVYSFFFMAQYPYFNWIIILMDICFLIYSIWLIPAKTKKQYIQAGFFVWSAMLIGLILFTLVTIL